MWSKGSILPQHPLRGDSPHRTHVTEAIDVRISEIPASLAPPCFASPLKKGPILFVLFGPAAPLINPTHKISKLLRQFEAPQTERPPTLASSQRGSKTASESLRGIWARRHGVLPLLVGRHGAAGLGNRKFTSLESARGGAKFLTWKEGQLS